MIFKIISIEVNKYQQRKTRNQYVYNLIYKSSHDTLVKEDDFITFLIIFPVKIENVINNGKMDEINAYFYNEYMPNVLCLGKRDTKLTRINNCLRNLGTHLR